LENNNLTKANYLNLGGGTYTFRIPSSKVIAFSGQKWAQTPQPKQYSALTSAISLSFNSIASTGHFSTQTPHPLHKSGFISDRKFVELIKATIPILHHSKVPQQSLQQLQILVSTFEILE